MNFKEENIGFIGAGNMASALISGLVNEGYKNSKIFASSPEEEHLENLNREFSINVTKKNEDIIESAPTVVLAIKPNVVNTVLKELTASIRRKNTLIISIVAGLTIDSIEAKVGTETKIIRAMPNTPASVGMGVSALTKNLLANQEDQFKAESIFNSVGISCWLKETYFDLYTALIGSGPAYIFYFIEALQDSVKKFDLDDNLSKKLIIEMMKGSTTLAGVSKDPPSLLREKVTSPGGVTETALGVLNKNKVKQSIVEAILEGTKRSKILGEKKDE
tara:strand:+ start:4094 stop:4921 length:828 start_codon:yes stop_codon:yes gene_type:complete